MRRSALIALVFVACDSYYYITEKPPTGCISNSDCDDGDSCTNDFCLVNSTCRSVTSTQAGCVWCATDSDEDNEVSVFCGGRDCDDNDPLVYPLEAELCDGVDNTCDGQVDELCNYHFESNGSISDWCVADGPWRTINNPTPGQGLVIVGEADEPNGWNGMYYLGRDGRRYIFPNSATFTTWYGNAQACAMVRQVPRDLLAEIPMGGNVCYRPGTRLLKLVTDPRVFAVAHHCTVREILDESVAEAVFGSNWRDLVDVIPDAFFVNYALGLPVTGESDYFPEHERWMSYSIDANLDL